MRIFAHVRTITTFAALATAGPAIAQDPNTASVAPQGDAQGVAHFVFQDKLLSDASQLSLYVAGRSEDVGAGFSAVDAALRTQLGLSGNGGLVIVEVQDGGRAARAGLKVNDILLRLGGRPLEKPDDVLVSLKAWSHDHKDRPCDLNLIRKGQPLTIQVKADSRVALGAVSEETPEFFIGTPANPLDAAFRAHLDVPEGTGLIVGEIEEGTPAAKGGVKSGDILLQFDGQPLPTVETLRAKVQAKGSHPAKLQVLRAGKPTEVTVTPERRKTTGAIAMDPNGTGSFILWNTQEAQTGTPVLRDVPYLARLFDNTTAQQVGKYATYRAELAGAATAPTPDLAKKIDDLTAQVQALTKAVETLRAEKK